MKKVLKIIWEVAKIITILPKVIEYIKNNK